jgi:protein phosphatase
MDLRVASLSDPGRVREQNEDAALSDLPLVAIADGVGGHKAGEVASAMALEVLGRWKPRLFGKQGLSAAEVLREAIAEANRAVYDRARSDDTVAGMGTTVTAVWLEGEEAAVAHVGDSRAYLLRGDKIEKLTEDQNVAQQWVRQGRLSEDEAATSPQRHILLQAVGTDPKGITAEIASIRLRPGDRLLLATDGLHGMVKDAQQIREILGTHRDPDEACRALVDAANAAGGHDNITVVIVDAGTSESAVAADEPVVVEKPTIGRRRLRIGRRPLALAAAALVGLGVIVLAAVWLTGGPSYVVAAKRGKVVVLDGTPGGENGVAHGRVVRVYADRPVDGYAPTVQSDLRTGIPVASLAQADRVVANLPRLLGPQDTAPPTPSPVVPSPHPTPAPKK